MNLGSHTDAEPRFVLHSRTRGNRTFTLTTDPPSHLRDCPPEVRFRVSTEVQKRYPPSFGAWKNPCWVVIIRGRDIGIFFEYWYVFGSMKGK